MFGKDKKDNKNNKSSQQPRRQHYENSDDGSFNMNSYKRGVVLSQFHNDEPVAEERRRLQKLRLLRRRLAALIATIAIILAFGLALLTQFAGSISGAVATDKNIKLSDTDVTKYVGIVNEYFAKNSFERFSFARRKSVLLQYIEDKAPEVSSVSFFPSGLSSYKLHVTVRKPVAMWISGNKTEFVDEKGIVFQQNFYGVPSLAIEDSSGASVSNGRSASSTFLSFVGLTATKLNKAGYKVSRVIIPKGSIRYVEFYLDGRNFPFKAQITRDSGSQAHDIEVMARYVDSHKITPQYIDCRVEGKAYWK